MVCNNNPKSIIGRGTFSGCRVGNRDTFKAIFNITDGQFAFTALLVIGRSVNGGVKNFVILVLKPACLWNKFSPKYKGLTA